MIFGKAKKRMRELEELLDIYKDELAKQHEKHKFPMGMYVPVAVPHQDDMRSYFEAVANITNNPLTLFYLVQLRRSIVDSFETDTLNIKAEYYRGMLACVGMILEDSRKAKTKLEQGNAAI